MHCSQLSETSPSPRIRHRSEAQMNRRMIQKQQETQAHMQVRGVLEGGALRLIGRLRHSRALQSTLRSRDVSPLRSRPLPKVSSLFRDQTMSRQKIELATEKRAKARQVLRVSHAWIHGYRIRFAGWNLNAVCLTYTLCPAFRIAFVTALRWLIQCLSQGHACLSSGAAPLFARIYMMREIIN